MWRLDRSIRIDYYNQYIRSDAGRYTALKRAAKDKALGFDISAEQHAQLLRKMCVYCGSGLPPTGHGLDRIDNSVGYLLSNVVPCCVSCNRIRNRYLSHDEMKVAMRAVMEYRNR